MTDSEDRAIVRRFLRDRSEASFRRLYRRHTPRMLRVAASFSDSGAAAEDIVQEAWIRAVKALDGFAWRSGLATWLAGFVFNVGREFRRSARSRPVERPAMASGLVVETVLVEWPRVENVTDLGVALRRLPEGFRSVLLLHDLGGFTHAEIAAMLDIEPGTSKSQLFRARRRLQEHLGATLTRNEDDD